MPAITPATAAVLADALLVLHVAVVAFVVAGLLAILLGGPLGWRAVRGRTFRIAHLATIAVVALQAWLGRLCPLTTWEQALRMRAGQDTYGGSFIQHWLSRLLYLDLPWSAFVAAYTAVAVLAAFAWWRWPPARPRR